MRYPKLNVTIPFVTVFAAAAWSLYSPVAAQDFLVGGIRLMGTGAESLAYAKPPIHGVECHSQRLWVKASRTSRIRRMAAIASHP